MNQLFLIPEGEDAATYFEKFNHARKWGAAVAQGLIKISPGELGHVYFYHDDWCLFLKGLKRCNCNPDIFYNDQEIKPRKWREYRGDDDEVMATLPKEDTP